MSLSRALGPHRLSKLVPATTTFVHKKSLALTPVQQARVYGPDTSGPANTGHWKSERVLAAVLAPLTPVAVMFPNMAFDLILSATLIVHTHWGLHEVTTDYIHGPIKKGVDGAILVFSIMAFGGLCYLSYNDVGFGNAVRMLYSQL